MCVRSAVRVLPQGWQRLRARLAELKLCFTRAVLLGRHEAAYGVRSRGGGSGGSSWVVASGAVCGGVSSEEPDIHELGVHGSLRDLC